jgi:hypothetical protein
MNTRTISSKYLEQIKLEGMKLDQYVFTLRFTPYEKSLGSIDFLAAANLLIKNFTIEEVLEKLLEEAQKDLDCTWVNLTILDTNDNYTIVGDLWNFEEEET